MQHSSEWAVCRPLLQNIQMRIVDGRREITRELLGR